MIRATAAALLLLAAAPLVATAMPGDPDPNTALPADFEGKVAYFGNYTGSTTILADNGRWRPRDCPAKDRRCDLTTVGGGMKVVLEFKGEYVTGFYYTVDGFEGPNGLLSGTLTGRRVPSGCELFQSDGTVWRGSCNKREFKGEIGSVAGVPKQADVTYSTVGMFVRDTGLIDRLTEAAAARKARIEWLRGAVSSSDALDYRMRAAAELSSYAYWPQGVPADAITFRDFPNKIKKDRLYEVRGDYPLPDNALGSVTVGIVSDGRFVRVECVGWAGGLCERGFKQPIPIDIPQEEDDRGWFSFSSAPIVPGRPSPRGDRRDD